jgi:hypothetical protein
MPCADVRLALTTIRISTFALFALLALFLSPYSLEPLGHRRSTLDLCLRWLYQPSAATAEGQADDAAFPARRAAPTFDTP